MIKPPVYNFKQKLPFYRSWRRSDVSIHECADRCMGADRGEVRHYVCHLRRFISLHYYCVLSLVGLRNPKLSFGMSIFRHSVRHSHIPSNFWIDCRSPWAWLGMDILPSRWTFPGLVYSLDGLRYRLSHQQPICKCRRKKSDLSRPGTGGDRGKIRKVSNPMEMHSGFSAFLGASASSLPQQFCLVYGSS